MLVVGAIIKNLAGEYLLQLRDEHAPSFQHCWTLFGGAVEPGETPKQALLRELHEELELTPDQIKSLQQIQDNHDQTGIQQIILELETSAALSDLTLHEGEAMQFVTEQDLFQRTFAFNIERVLRAYLGRQPNEHN